MSIVVWCVLSAVAATLATWIVLTFVFKHGEAGRRLEGVENSLASAFAGTFIVFPTRNLTRCSRATLQLLGLPLDKPDLANEEWMRLVHEDDRPELVNLAKNAIERGIGYALDYRISTHGGYVRWMRVHAQPTDTRGREPAIHGLILDITNIKHLELEVRARDERLRDAARAASFETFEIDLDRVEITIDRPIVHKRERQPGETLVSNETYTHSLEASRAKHHPDDRHLHEEMIERIKTQNVPFLIEARTMQTDGSYRWTLAHGRLVRDAAGPRRVRGVIQDIDARKQAELRVREAEARLERIARGTNDGMLELDLITKKMWVSPRLAQMLGTTQEQLAAAPNLLTSLTHPEDATSLRKAIDQHIHDGAVFDVEFRQRTMAGDWRWYRVRGQCERDAQGVPVKLSGSQQDITERRQYQQALIEATEAASAASRAKSEFLANMSHEIRTPMNGVLGMTDMLLETPLNAAQREYAETVRKSGAALLTIINDILDFSKVEAGKLDLELLDVDLRDTIEDVARLLSIQAHVKHLEVAVTIDPIVPDLVNADAGRLRQVLLNLGGNAVKFTPKGKVAIDVKVIGRDAQGMTIRCEVRDTGIGIPDDRVSALFKPFSQVDTSNTRKFGGTGLGLSIVRRLVDLMGGETGVTSEEGVGSTFWFTTRLGNAKAGSNTVAPSPDALRGRRILVVDDNPTNRKVIVGQLAMCNTVPACAGSADEALTLLHEAARVGQPFEVVLLDHQMPGCDGATLGQTVLKDAQLRSTRLVLLTSTGQRGDGQRFAELGFAGYLIKPVTQRDLMDCLLLVLAARPEQWHMQTQPIITRHELRSRRGREKHRLLLAEDNAVNQKVAVRTLEKLGFRVDVVDNGRAAVEAWRTGRYHLILMDCQMPELDGYEATREIRQLEAGNARVPIVALTAHAMKGADAECLAAGMDAYLTKPIDRARLESCLERFLGAEQKDVLGDTGTNPVTQENPLDWERLLQALGGDEAFARELVTLFVASGESSLEEIAGALERGDYEHLGAKAHELKGASSNLQATAATTAASRLEVAARNGDVDQVAQLAKELKTEVTRAIQYLRQHVA